MVHHDASLARTTDRTQPLDSLTADELAGVDAACHFRPAPDRRWASPLEPLTAGSGDGRGGAATPAGAASSDEPGRAPLAGQGIGIPTLAAVLARYRDTRIIIELKLNTPALGRAVVDVVRAARADDRVCLGSFGQRVLREARRLAPHIATSAAREEVRWALYRSWVRWPVKRVAYAGYQVPEMAGPTRVVSQRFVEYAHRAGLGVQVWTVDELPQAERLLAWGVDAVISDRPDRLREFVVGRAASRSVTP